MAKVVKLEDEVSRLLRGVSASQGVSFGCDAPYALGKVGWIRRGFADRFLVKVNGFARARDLSALVPVARQHILRAVAAADLPLHAIDLMVHIKQERERLFTDTNPTSQSCGKRKRGVAVEFALEISNRMEQGVFVKKLDQLYSPGGN